MKTLGERMREAMQGEPLRLTLTEWGAIRNVLGPPAKKDVLLMGAIGNFDGIPVIIIEETS